MFFDKMWTLPWRITIVSYKRLRHPIWMNCIFLCTFHILTHLHLNPIPPPLSPHSTIQSPTLWNVFSNFLIEDYLLIWTTHYMIKRDLPYELKDFAIITFDCGNGEKVPEYGSTLLIIQYAAIKASSSMYHFSDFCNIFLICFRSLQKSTITTKCSSPLV
jgi:hypothetical protein